jgi:hypothetical protein
MRNLWCKLWSWFLNTLNDVGDAVAHTLQKAGTVAADLLTTVASGVGNAVGSIFGGGNFLVWAGIGLLAYFVLTKQDDEDKAPSIIGGRYVGSQ